MAGLLWLPLCAQGGQATDILCIYQGRTETELARFATDHTAGFSLSFVHSVSLTPVMDNYEIRAPRIHQTSEIFEAHGAGLPSFAGDVGEKSWRLEDGKFVLEMDRQFRRIQLRIQPEYRNTLHIADQEITLAEFGTSSIGLGICE